MGQSVNVNIRMDEELKKQAEQLFAEFGMNMTTAFTIFVKAVVRERRIPFEISAPADDFYNEYNQARLKKSINALNAGNTILDEHVDFTWKQKPYKKYVGKLSTESYNELTEALKETERVDLNEW